jgi:threonine dehydratase
MNMQVELQSNVSDELRQAIRPTTWVESPRLSRRLGVDVVIASETLQHTGSFKYRAAFNVVSRMEQQRILTASSGNFGQAIARACAVLGKQAIIVMPHTSAQVKIDAVREYGAVVDLTDVRVKGRNERVQELRAEYPDAYIGSAYDDPLVIEGNSSLGDEVVAAGGFDAVVAPVGGGGLTSGLVMGAQRAGSTLKVFGAEPAIANDAARSLRAGHIVANEVEPMTIADGARTPSLGQHNWAILQHGIAGIVEVPEEAIREAMRMLFTFANLKVEPTGALPVAAVMVKPELFRDQRVCCVASGGNVDPGLYCEIIGAETSTK